MDSCFTVLGSGASSGVPWLGCVLEDKEGGVTHGCCAVCADALSTPYSRNRRSNVSCALRFARPDGAGLFNVVVDCGKTFRETCTRVWPGLSPPMRRLHALLLSHPHADAFMGLDCLREASPGFPVHVYCHAPTMARIREAFPYLVPSEAAARAAAAAAAAAARCCAGEGGAQAQAPMPKTYIADLVFHMIEPWVPFELEGSGGLLVTPIPLEHSGRMGVPSYNEAQDSCLGFEFGAVLAQPGAAQPQTEPAAGQPQSEGAVTLAGSGGSSFAGSAPPSQLRLPLPLDGRGLPRLPAFTGDRVLWLSDLRAVSAEVRAYLASRPITVLCLDSLGQRPCATHFSLGQAVACAVDLAGPHSASAGAARVLLVGMCHELDHDGENAKLAGVCASARVARPAQGARPLVWQGSPSSSSEDPQAFQPLSLASISLAHDGASLPVAITHRASLEGLGREVAALRAAAAALCAGDGFDYAQAAQAAEVAMKAQSTALEARHLPADSGERLALRRREDYWGALPPMYTGYEDSPSHSFRGAWRFTMPDGRRL